MNIRNQLPILRILIPFIAGIIAALSTDFNFKISLTAIIYFAVAISFISVLHNRIIRSYSNRWIFGLLASLFVFVCAYKMTSDRNIKNRISDFSYFRSGSDTVIAAVTEPTDERENTCRVLLEIKAVRNNNHWFPVSGMAITYFEKDSMSKALKYGDKLIAAADFADIKTPQNPGEFNYKRYLALKGIYTQGYVKSGMWKLLSHDEGNIIISTAFRIREKFLDIFETNNITGEEYAVAGALILGYKDKIDADLIKVYQSSGALHILCVSGMHVGVVYFVLNFLLAFLNRFKKGKFIKPVILILVIWFYAGITGFSPAVNRASIMISLVIIGKAGKMSPDIYNTLAVSMLSLLIFNPLLIMDVGFQLSYIAVIGIVAVQNRIYKLWSPRFYFNTEKFKKQEILYILRKTGSWLSDQAWLIISVSIAAQIATFPLALMYFHQFPNYFPITNLIVAPLSTFIIYCGMLVLIISPVNFIASVSSKLLVLLIFALNESLRIIEGLPFSATKGIFITPVEMALLYLLIILIIIFFTNKRAIFLKFAMVCTLIFFSLITIRSAQNLNQKKLIVYNIKKTLAIDFISGGNHVLLGDSGLFSNQKAISFHLQNNWYELRLSPPEKIDKNNIKGKSFQYDSTLVFLNGGFIQFYDKRLVIINNDNYRFVSANPIKVDYMIISGNIRTDIAGLLDSYKPGKIIIDSSNSLRKAKQWTDECEKLNIPCYSVLNSGAFEVSI